MTRANIILIASTFMLLAGCANTQSVYRKYNIQDDGPESVIIDAKQRAINSVNRKNTEDIRVCSEPPPDAVSAISSAFSAAGGNGQVQAQLGAALTEAVGKLTKRNATVELLRYFAFSHCQAYASDGITKQSYEQGLEQIADLSVTLLAIEQVTSPNSGESPLALTAGQAGVSVTYTPPTTMPPPTPGDATTNTTTTTTQPGNDNADDQENDTDDQDSSSESVSSPQTNGALSTTLSAGEGAMLQLGTTANQTVSDAVAGQVRLMLANTLTKRLQNECLKGLVGIIDGDANRTSQLLSKNAPPPAIQRELLNDLNARTAFIRRELLNDLNARTAFINACQTVLTNDIGQSTSERSNGPAIPSETSTPLLESL